MGAGGAGVLWVWCVMERMQRDKAEQAATAAKGEINDVGATLQATMARLERGSDLIPEHSIDEDSTSVQEGIIGVVEASIDEAEANRELEETRRQLSEAQVRASSLERQLKDTQASW